MNGFPSQAPITRETLMGLLERVRTLANQGATHENSPEFHRLVTHLNQYQQKQAPQLNGIAPDSNNSEITPHNEPEPLQLTPAQQATLKVQILALRHLQSNHAVPANILEALADPAIAMRMIEDNARRQAAPKQQSPAQDQAIVVEPSQPAPAVETVSVVPAIDEYDYDTDPEDTTSLLYPYNSYSTPAEAQAAQIKAAKFGVVVPNFLPPGIDIRAMQEERNLFIEARIAQRVRELESLPANMADKSNVNYKLKALVELKALNLLAKQKQLREDVLRGMQQITSLSLVADHTAFKRIRKPSIKESRNVENFERKQKVERERKAKQKLTDRLEAVARHAQALKQANYDQVEAAQRIGKQVVRFHQEAERAEKARVERVSKERLRALKNDDEEAYLKLIDTAKDTRITHLIRQTDSFLTGLSKNVMAQQKAAGVFRAAQAQEEAFDESAFGAQPVFEEEAESTKVDYYNVAHRIKEIVTDQPTNLVGGSLKSYQIKGLQWMVSLVNNRLNGILADEMGLGKTIQSIALVCYMIETKRIPGPFLIIVPLSTIPNWITEFDRWAPSVKLMVYKGGPSVRKSLGDEMRRSGSFQVCLTTYEFIIRDRPNLARPNWAHMIIDEGHRLKNTNSKLSSTLAQYYRSAYRLILTGTPLQNNLPELWALLNFVLPKVFNSVQSFDEWFNTPFANTGGQDKIALNEEEQLLVIRRLHKVLRPFLLRRLKKDVEADLPDKVERIIRCKMSALQIKLYNQMKDHGALVVEDQSGKSKQGGLKGLQNTIMQLRKICNHPFVYQAVENSVKRPHQNEELLYRVAGKFELLDRILPKLFATGHRVLMFFQMTQIMDIMQDYLAYRNTPNLRLDGSTGQDIRGDIMRQFNAPDCPYNIFLLSTRAGGLGLNLQTADTVILYDSDWNPHQDLQAQDRAHRIGQKKEVRIFRLVTSQSVEEHIVATANLKKEMDSKVIQAGKFDNNSTNAEREEHLRAILEATIEEEDVEGDYTDAELNEILARGDAEFDLFQQMDMERRRNDEAFWRARGNHGPVPERLFQDHELPAIYHQAPSFAKKEPDPIFDDVTGRRKRNAASNVHYDDGLSEEQFLKAVEGETSGDLHDTIAANRAKKDRRKQNRVQALLDEAGSPASTGDFGQTSRGRSRVSDDGDDQSESEAGDRRKRGRRSTLSVEPSMNGDDEDAPRSKRRRTGSAVNDKNNEFKPIYKKILDAVKNVETPEGYDACGLFLDVPSKRDYPDYYVVIPQPIAIKQIGTKINKGTYASPADFRKDFQLMVANSRVYNDEQSTVVRDADMMMAEFGKAGETKRGFLTLLDRKYAELIDNRPQAAPTIIDSDDDEGSINAAPSKLKLTFGGQG